VPPARGFSIFCFALTVIAVLIAASIAVLYGRVRPGFALNAIPPAALALVALKRVKQNPWKLALSSVGLSFLVVFFTLPVVLRARPPHAEPQMIGDARSFAWAMESYAAENGGFYEGRLECLLRPWDGCIPGYPESAPPFLWEDLARLGETNGYLRSFHPGAKVSPEEIAKASASPTSVRTWVLLGTPVDDQSRRSYCVDYTGTLCRFVTPSSVMPSTGEHCPPECEPIS
jgi:hypothetical protein